MPKCRFRITELSVSYHKQTTAHPIWGFQFCGVAREGFQDAPFVSLTLVQ